MFEEFSTETIDQIMQDAWQAFQIYKNTSLKDRAGFMRSIANEIKQIDNVLIETAMQETHLTESRLTAELDRTVHQLNSYGAFCKSGQWLDVRIDTADASREPAKPDIRKMLVPLGPVVVFGAANFPFAYSTAGGDTACAFAAGCPVIVKAHPGHAKTSELVAGAIMEAAENCKLPKGIFGHVHGASTIVGETLVKHSFTKAVGFTGSFAGGKQLFDWGNQRKEPIAVFAEMSSVNPVFLLPDKMKTAAINTARLLAASITTSVGQFCTNPGIVIGIKNTDLTAFINELRSIIEQEQPAAMLNTGIYKNYIDKRKTALSVGAVTEITKQHDAAAVASINNNDGLLVKPTIAITDAAGFIANPQLQQEVFGPYSIIVECSGIEELQKVAASLAGQLTATVMATETDIRNNEELITTIQNLCGRFILNGVPTGVEVCLAMQHGGPFPSTTDSRFTSVGADGIKRFARPLAYQNWPDTLLPDALKASNPLGIWRTVNNVLENKMS